jgi:hypothetical protein
VSLHEDKPKEVNIVFVSQPLNPRGGGSNPLGPSGPPKLPRYLVLPMVNLGKPPLPPNIPYHWPLNYFEYVKNSDLGVHVRVFKATIRVNNEIDDAKIINLFNFTLRNTMFDWCNNYMGEYPDCTFVELQLAFCKRYKKGLKMMNKFTYISKT